MSTELNHPLTEKKYLELLNLWANDPFSGDFNEFLELIQQPVNDPDDLKGIFERNSEE